LRLWCIVALFKLCQLQVSVPTYLPTYRIYGNRPTSGSGTAPMSMPRLWSPNSVTSVHQSVNQCTRKAGKKPCVSVHVFINVKSLLAYFVELHSYTAQSLYNNTSTQNLELQCTWCAKKKSNLFLSKFRQISSKFDNFWHTDSQYDKIM